VVGVVTKPFYFEGGKRRSQALSSIKVLKPNVDVLITVANDKLLTLLPDGVTMVDALTCADDILRQGVVGITDIIVQPGLINVDFSDVRSIMKGAGSAIMGIGSAAGPNRAREAAMRAVASPLLDVQLDKATGSVFNIVGGKDMTLSEVNEAAQVIYESMDPDANIIFGALVDDHIPSGSEVIVTMVATGFDNGDMSTQNDNEGEGAAAEVSADVPDFISRLQRQKRR